MNTLVKRIEGTRWASSLALLLLAAGTCIVGPSQARAGGTDCQQVYVRPVPVDGSPCVQWRKTGTHVYGMRSGYTTVVVDGVHYYTYGGGIYFRALADLDHVIYLKPE